MKEFLFLFLKCGIYEVSFIFVQRSKENNDAIQVPSNVVVCDIALKVKPWRSMLPMSMVDLINVNPWDLWIVNAQSILIFTYDLENQVMDFSQSLMIKVFVHTFHDNMRYNVDVFNQNQSVGKHPLGFPIRFSLEKKKCPLGFLILLEPQMWGSIHWVSL